MTQKKTQRERERKKMSCAPGVKLVVCRSQKMSVAPPLGVMHDYLQQRRLMVTYHGRLASGSEP